MTEDENERAERLRRLLGQPDAEALEGLRHLQPRTAPVSGPSPRPRRGFIVPEAAD